MFYQNRGHTYILTDSTPSWDNRVERLKSGQRSWSKQPKNDVTASEKGGRGSWKTIATSVLLYIVSKIHAEFSCLRGEGQEAVEVSWPPHPLFSQHIFLLVQRNMESCAPWSYTNVWWQGINKNSNWQRLGLSGTELRTCGLTDLKLEWFG